jgi:hypothetical protein
VVIQRDNGIISSNNRLKNFFLSPDAANVVAIGNVVPVAVAIVEILVPTQSTTRRGSGPVVA